MTQEKSTDTQQEVRARLEAAIERAEADSATAAGFVDAVESALKSELPTNVKWDLDGLIDVQPQAKYSPTQLMALEARLAAEARDLAALAKVASATSAGPTEGAVEANAKQLLVLNTWTEKVVQKWREVFLDTAPEGTGPKGEVTDKQVTDFGSQMVAGATAHLGDYHKKLLAEFDAGRGAVIDRYAHLDAPWAKALVAPSSTNRRNQHRVDAQEAKVKAEAASIPAAWAVLQTVADKLAPLVPQNISWGSDRELELSPHRLYSPKVLNELKRNLKVTEAKWLAVFQNECDGATKFVDGEAVVAKPTKKAVEAALLHSDAIAQRQSLEAWQKIVDEEWHAVFDRVREQTGSLPAPTYGKFGDAIVESADYITLNQEIGKLNELQPGFVPDADIVLSGGWG